MKAHASPPKDNKRIMAVQANRHLASYAQRSMKDTTRTRDRKLSFMQEANRPLIELYNSTYKTTPSILRALATGKAKRSSSLSPKPFSGLLRNRPTPFDYPWKNKVPRIRHMILDATTSHLPAPDQGGGGTHTPYSSLSWLAVEGSPGTLGGGFSVEGGGFVSATQLQGYEYLSSDAGPATLAVAFNPQGYVAIDDDFGLAYESCTARIVVQNVTASLEPMPAGDPIDYSDHFLFPNGLVEREFTAQFTDLYGGFDRLPNTEYIIWVQFDFSLAAIYLGGILDPLPQNPLSIEVSQFVSIGAMNIWEE